MRTCKLGREAGAHEREQVRERGGRAIARKLGREADAREQARQRGGCGRARPS